MKPFWRESEFWVVVAMVAPAYLAYKGLDPETVDKVMEHGKIIVTAYLAKRGVDRFAESKQAQAEEQTHRERMAERKVELQARLEKERPATDASRLVPLSQQQPYASPFVEASTINREPRFPKAKDSYSTSETEPVTLRAPGQELAASKPDAFQF